jgi:single-strand DNA-binding protein
VLRPYASEMTLLDGKGGGNSGGYAGGNSGGYAGGDAGAAQGGDQSAPSRDMDDEIPF